MLSDEIGLFTREDIEEDLKCAQVSAEAFETFSDHLLHSADFRGFRFPRRHSPPALPPSGAFFSRHFTTPSREVYQALLGFEHASRGKDWDLSCLVTSTGIIVEGELDRLLAKPAAALGETLLRVFSKKETKKAGIIEDWLAQRKPLTLSLLTILLMVLRRGFEQALPHFKGFLEEHFAPPYEDLLIQKGLGQALERVRGLRNQAAHAFQSRRPVNHLQYQEFASLVVGQTSFGDWDAVGPHPNPPRPDKGVLHHHLACSQKSPVLPNAANEPDLASLRRRLLSLASPSQSELRLCAKLMYSEKGNFRELFVLAPPGLSCNRGDFVRFSFQPDGDCYLYALDVGTGGSIALLFPNFFERDNFLSGGGQVHYLPGRTSPKFGIKVGGPAGTERVVFIATRISLPLPCLDLSEKQPFHRFTGLDLSQFLSQLHELPKRIWAVTISEFTLNP
jgi:hypothetical protein